MLETTKASALEVASNALTFNVPFNRHIKYDEPPSAIPLSGPLHGWIAPTESMEPTPFGEPIQPIAFQISVLLDQPALLKPV
jgi:hypothetical protein